MTPSLTPEPFRWRDGERLIVFGRGRAAEAPELLGDRYLLLSTPRARAAAPAIAAAAAKTIDVPPGRVDELAGELLERAAGAALLVGLGGGRVIDVAKALAAAHRARAAAVSTTLSGAEMTRGHRHAAGVDPATPRVRPAVVVCDPELAASQPVDQMAASAMNALGHAVEGPVARGRNPVATLAAHAGAALLLRAFSASEVDGDAAALGALLAGYTIDSTGYGLHHVAAQTLARFAGVSHAAANAVLLPHTSAALRRRAPDRLAAMDAALGMPAEEAAGRLLERFGRRRLRDAGAEEGALERCAKAASERPDLAGTPPAAGEAEILALY